MLVTKFFSLAFVASAMASPVAIVKRDLATVQAAFRAIETQVTALKAGIADLTPETDPQAAVDSLTALSGSVTTTIETGTTSVSGTSALSLVDSLSLLSSSNSLVSAVGGVVDDLISKKPIIDAADASSIVVDQLVGQKTASQAFIAAVVSKVPSSVANLANQQAQAVVTALDRGITAFGGSP